MDIYESIVILDSLIPPKEIDEALERFSAIITENKGKMRKVEKWGKKRLAFEIQKKQYGFYASIEFDGKGTIPALLQGEYNYNDNVLRYLTYRYDKNKLKALEADVPESAAAKPTPAPAPEPVIKPVAEKIVEEVVKKAPITEVEEIVEETPVAEVEEIVEAEVEEKTPQMSADSEETAEESKE